MGSSDSGFRDAVDATLNPDPTDPPAAAAATVPGRPAASAAKAAWIDYCVALGADRAYLQGETWHYDPEWDPAPGNPDVEHYASRSPLTRDELIGLADRLGG